MNHSSDLCREKEQLMLFFFVEKNEKVSKKSLYMCFVDLKKKVFDRVPKNVVKWAMGNTKDDSESDDQFIQRSNYYH